MRLGAGSQMMRSLPERCGISRVVEVTYVANSMSDLVQLFVTSRPGVWLLAVVTACLNFAIRLFNREQWEDPATRVGQVPG